ncbi:MAG: hypothetical protein LBQ47_00680, partial [Endomicrobium sp.]|nr:hypothetical protein [Endomicrobium sp.]
MAGFFSITKEELLQTIKEKQKDAPYLIFEANNGAAPVLLETVLSALGIDADNVEIRHAWRDVVYGAVFDDDRGAPEPNEANLKNLKNAITQAAKKDSSRQAIGAATDVDADRLGTLLYSRNGQTRALTPNDMALIMAYVSLNGKKSFSSNDLLVRTSPSGHILDYLAAKFGVKTASVNVGSKYIAEQINDPQNNVILGMESSGTILFKEWIKDKDGIMANMLMYLIPLITGKSYSDILDEIYGEIGYEPAFVEAKADLGKTEEEKAGAKNAAVDFFKTAEKEEIAKMLSELGLPKDLELVSIAQQDGLYLGFRNAKTDEIRQKTGKLQEEGVIDDIIWLQLRASGTENAIRIYAESYDEELTKKLVQASQKLINLLAAVKTKEVETDRGDTGKPTLTERESYKALEEHYEEMSEKTIKELRAPENAEDAKQYIKELQGKKSKLYFDFSFNNINGKTIKLLLDLAKDCGLKEFIEAMFSGKKINTSENRAVLHTALRNVDMKDGKIVSKGAVEVDGKDVMPDIVKVLEKMRGFVNDVRSGKWKGATDKPVKHVISIGIGGSDLG